jgi:hypothetical protein
METLPNETLCHLFQFVPMDNWLSVMLVCKNWHQLSEKIFVPGNRMYRRLEMHSSSFMCQNPIQWCCIENKIESLKRLLRDKNAITDPDNDMALSLACVNRRTDIVSVLLKDMRMTPHGAVLLHASYKTGAYDILPLLLDDYRIGPSISNNLLLRLALADGNTNVVSMIFRHENFNLGEMVNVTDPLANAHSQSKNQFLEAIIGNFGELCNFEYYLFDCCKMCGVLMNNIDIIHTLLSPNAMYLTCIYGTNVGLLLLPDVTGRRLLIDIYNSTMYPTSNIRTVSPTVYMDVV